ncbi:hypothetical protein [Schwartzia succinivorans]|jgi:hypothetical protein|uniref:Uncharacterized protein n=1 Tax=Schwartzia succinivorans DSM 10502 TaxID=1123243 RepID=A0A1M4UI12_9FIRM|nr:hypothetical protein [Schwartzia succinivorans]SHE56304.1 hypothetical protein SAMN02745190_00666 [Schwartzia succinivorans DSM 10502]
MAKLSKEEKDRLSAKLYTTTDPTKILEQHDSMNPQRIFEIGKGLQLDITMEEAEKIAEENRLFNGTIALQLAMTEEEVRAAVEVMPVFSGEEKEEFIQKILEGDKERFSK